MYAFLDRPVSLLDGGGGFLIGAMREWTAAIHAQCCPAEAIMPLFSAWGLADAARHFQLGMAIIHGHSLIPLEGARQEALYVQEGEAAFLSILAALPHAPRCRTRASLSFLVAQEWVGPLLVTLVALSEHLDAAGLLPHGGPLPAGGYDE